MQFSYLAEAFQIVFVPAHFLALALATFVGVVVGILPGLTATMAVALLTGLTFGFGPVIAVVALIGVYEGAISGGGQAGILLNIPGTPASAATVLDGYPMNRQGKAGLAIFLATGASMCGTILAAIFLLFLTPPLAAIGLYFQSYEFFLLALFGIVICGNLASNGDALKGWMAGFLGLLISMVGLDPIAALPRFSFDNIMMRGGLPLIPLMIAIFGIPEILKVFGKQTAPDSQITKFNVGEGVKILGKNTPALLRSGSIGTFMGIIPGVGEDVGGWMSYWATKSISKTKERFGKGAPEGVISVEAGANAAKTGALIPVLSLAIPGSTSAAILLAAFFMHGHRPGPLLMGEDPGFVYQIAVYFVIAAILMFIFAMGLSRFSVRILKVDKTILMPIIFTFCAIGAFLVRYVFFDVRVMFLGGFIGFLLLYARFPAAPLLLGMVLGDMAEANLVRGMMLSDGSFEPFVTRPISLIFVIVISLLVFTQLPFFGKLVNLVKGRKKNPEEEK
ncbi:MAG: tripartite tricarboxylate transporter permease [Spirochaetes bacterium]|nr:tripartite tricarboxylate transporter permease [Spirochaetota bacterium]